MASISGMIKKWCSSCHRETWHNPRKSSGSYRCTFCGDPVSTNPARKDQQEFVRRKQSASLV